MKKLDNIVSIPNLNKYFACMIVIVQMDISLWTCYTDCSISQGGIAHAIEGMRKAVRGCYRTDQCDAA